MIKLNTMNQARLLGLDFIGSEDDWKLFVDSSKELKVYVSKHPIREQHLGEGDILFKARGTIHALARWAEVMYDVPDPAKFVNLYAERTAVRKNKIALARLAG